MTGRRILPRRRYGSFSGDRDRRRFARRSVYRGNKMALKIKKSVKELVAEANAEVETVTVAEALKLKEDPTVTFVDIRDIRELDRDGRIPGAFHAPRGMLEFWVDPESPYYRDIFA